MAETLVLTEDQYLQDLDALKENLFRKLNESGFEKPPHFRIANLGDGVSKDGVEIRATSTIAGLNIVIVLALDVREDEFFGRTRQVDTPPYMISKHYVNIRGPYPPLTQYIDLILRIAQQGAAIVFFNQEKLFDQKWSPKDQPESIEPKKLSTKEIGTLGLFFGLSVGALIGWENTKELIDFLAAQDILQINKDVRQAIQDFAEMEINAHGTFDRFIWRSSFALALGTVGKYSFIIAAKIADVFQKIRQNKSGKQPHN